jgi:hypothetical protein
MENHAQQDAGQNLQLTQMDPKDVKEGYVPFIVQKGNHRILMYIELGMPLFAAYDAALDIAVHIRDLYRQQIEKAIAEQNEAAKQTAANVAEAL